MKDKIVIWFTDETVAMEAQCSGRDLIMSALVIIKELAKTADKEVSEVIDSLKLLMIENKEGEN